MRSSNRKIPLTLTLASLVAASVANATGTLTIESAQGNGQWITTVKPGQMSSSIMTLRTEAQIISDAGGNVSNSVAGTYALTLKYTPDGNEAPPSTVTVNWNVKQSALMYYYIQGTPSPYGFVSAGFKGLAKFGGTGTPYSGDLGPFPQATTNQGKVYNPGPQDLSSKTIPITSWTRSGPPTSPTYTATVNWIDASGQTYASADSMLSYPLYAYASWTLELGALGFAGLPTVTSP